VNTSKKFNISIVIPCYQPSPEFLSYVKELSENFSNILVVNDGSDHSCTEIFNSVAQYAHVITHEVNLGKGAALKTAIKHLSSQEDVTGMITVDADGQHLIKDVLNLTKHSLETPNYFMLGVRDFDNDIPLKSKFGNKLTLLILSAIYGLKLADSQTGLRYIPKRLFEELTTLKGNKYEYELQMLLLLNKNKEAIIQVPISTVYIENNASSHFRPLHDSFRIYSVFFQFGISSIVCFALDIFIFSLMLVLSAGNILVSTFVARVASGVANFTLNRNYVFSSKKSGGLIKESVGYLVLWASLILLSSSLVDTISSNFSEQYILPIKIIVDLLLFILSFHIQKWFIFKPASD